jgi:hypothetical protein
VWLLLGYLALDDAYDFRDQLDGLDAKMKNTYRRKAYRIHPPS